MIVRTELPAPDTIIFMLTRPPLRTLLPVSTRMSEPASTWFSFRSMETGAGFFAPSTDKETVRLPPEIPAVNGFTCSLPAASDKTSLMFSIVTGALIICCAVKFNSASTAVSPASASADEASS